MTSRAWVSNIVTRWGENAACWQIFNPGVDWYIDRDLESVIGYRAFGRGAVVVAEPIGPPVHRVEMIQRFHRRFKRVTWFGASERFKTLMQSVQPSIAVPIGFQTMVTAEEWPTRLAALPSLRYQINRARNKGCVVEPVAASDAAGVTRALSEWQDQKYPIRLYFMTDPHIALHPESRPMWVARYNDEIVGYIVASPVAHQNSWLLEQWIRRPSAPNGIIELLVDHCIRQLPGDARTTFTMGLCPLMSSPIAPNGRLDRWIQRVGRWVAQPFYDAQSLTEFKLKFGFPTHERLWALMSPRHSVLGCHIDSVLAFVSRPTTIVES